MAIMTINIDDALRTDIIRLARNNNQSTSAVVREALSSKISLGALDELQKAMEPIALSLGVETDDDAAEVVRRYRREKRQAAQNY